MIDGAGKRIMGRGLKEYLASEYRARSKLHVALDELEKQGVAIRHGWIKGHQDEEATTEKLSRESMLNINCDLQAGMLRADPPTEFEPRCCSP